jgi:hypothetical protein
MLKNDVSEKRERGRPLGEVAEAALSVLSGYPLTARQLAFRLQCSIPVAKMTCQRLRTAGRLTVTGYVKVAGSNRPVALYEAVIEEPANMTLDQIYCGRGAR